ncbi:MAG: alpha/beta hydrolase [Bacteroidales bacterium]|nr:alpha/beta hydrolase [Bacteroidales bacterium]
MLQLRIIMAALALALFSFPVYPQRTINRYGLELERRGEGYALKDEGKIRKYGLFDPDSVPADMFVPYERCRLYIQDKDFQQCETRVAVFKKYPGYELKIAVDLPKAKTDGKLPFIVWIHGGGWHTGDFGGHSLHSRYLAGNGIAGVRISYSLLTQGARFEDTWQDIQDAVAYIREHAMEYGLDPDRFGFAGHSAGGHLASYAAMRIPGAKMLASFNGIYDLVNTVDGFVPSVRHEDYFGLSSAESCRQASPVTFVHQDAPYCLLTYCSGDVLVDKGQAETFVKALKENNVEYDFLFKEYYSHMGFIDTDLLEPTLMRMLIEAKKRL